MEMGKWAELEKCKIPQRFCRFSVLIVFEKMSRDQRNRSDLKLAFSTITHFRVFYHFVFCRSKKSRKGGFRA